MYQLKIDDQTFLPIPSPQLKLKLYLWSLHLNTKVVKNQRYLFTLGICNNQWCYVQNSFKKKKNNPERFMRSIVNTRYYGILTFYSNILVK